MESSALFSDASYGTRNVLGKNDAKYHLSVISSLDLDYNSSFPCSFLIHVIFKNVFPVLPVILSRSIGPNYLI